MAGMEDAVCDVCGTQSAGRKDGDPCGCCTLDGSCPGTYRAPLDTGRWVRTTLAGGVQGWALAGEDLALCREPKGWYLADERLLPVTADDLEAAARIIRHEDSRRV